MTSMPVCSRSGTVRPRNGNREQNDIKRYVFMFIYVCVHVCLCVCMCECVCVCILDR